jgi:hypothetical protein
MKKFFNLNVKKLSKIIKSILQIKDEKILISSYNFKIKIWENTEKVLIQNI